LRSELSDGRIALAADAFVYGFPLVFDLQEVDRFTRMGFGSMPATPFNRFGHAPSLAGPEERFVSINTDTIYSAAQVDLSGGPLRLEVPATAGRYYVLQFIDAWTNNFAYIGHRATGTDAGSFLLVRPGDDGVSGAGSSLIRFPTDVGTILGRFAVDGEDDLPAVRALQGALTLSPEGEGSSRGLPEPEPSVPEELRFFEQLRVWMRAFPPPARDLDYQQRFETLGLLEEDSPYVDPDPGLARALRAGLEEGRRELERALRNGPTPKQNGWSLTYHTFDYNLDFFEVGALDDPNWKADVEPRSRYLLRAGAARGGLWGNHGYEAAYAMVYEDRDGKQLNGGDRYELRFERPPPVGAFWSVTMYDLPDFYLVANPVERYSIGDRTRGLHFAEDGSLTIVMQTDEPSTPEARANWLPTPPGEFRPLLRMYEPDAAVFDGGYELPPITKLATDVGDDFSAGTRS
jgi:hypothetical protein